MSSIRKRVSQRGNIYHEVSLEEILDHKNEDGEVMKVDWYKLFYSVDMRQEERESLEGKEVEATLAFYPVTRNTDKGSYTNINCHLESIKEI